MKQSFPSPKIYLIALLTVFALMMSGCGGGGGGTSPTSTPVPSPVPAPAFPTVQAAALLAALPAAYPVDTEQARVFAAINLFRVSQGLGPVVQSPNIDLAAKSHQNYVFTHQSGADGHKETVGKSGFTGVNPIERLVAAGFSATGATEVIAFNTTWPITAGTVIDVLADTVYHRSAMMGQQMTHFGVAPQNDNGPTYINMGYVTPQKNAGNYIGVYPVDGQTGVSLTHYVESPNPFYQELEMTSANMCSFTSYPVSIASEASTTLAVSSFTVTEAGQTATLPVRLFHKGTSSQDAIYLPQNVAFIVGKAPFKANTKYNIRFVGTASGSATGTANGMPIDKSWSFETGTDLRGCK